jgi:hypothetical protein
VTVHLSALINPGLSSNVTSIVNDGYRVTSAQGPSASGSPTITPIAPPFALSLSPAAQTDGARVGQSVTDHVTITNQGFNNDTYNLSSSGGTFPVTFLDSTCTTPLTATPTVSRGASTSVCVKVDVPASAADGATSSATITATSAGSASANATATLKTIAVAVNTLLVRDDEFSSTPVNVQQFYTDTLTANHVAFQLWDLGSDKNLPLNYLKSFKNVVWFTGNSFPAPLGQYEGELASYLDGGGNLFVSAQDQLDQSGGLAPFVSQYLHVNWDGTERQNDQLTRHVSGVVTSTITGAVGTVPIDDTVLGNDFMDEITPIAPATGIFTDDAGNIDALSFSGPSANTGTNYKVVFLAFPFEEYGTAAQKQTLMANVFTFFGS